MAEQERWVLARETVIEVPGERPQLGYTVFSGVGYFDSFETVCSAIKELGLPLGWVAMRTTQDPWNLLFPDAASAPLQHPSTRPSSVEGAHLSDERILHLWDTHVAYETGQSVKQPPLGNADKLAFARAVLSDASGVALPDGAQQ